VRTRAASLDALIVAEDNDADLRKLVHSDDELGMKELAVRGLIARKADVSEFAWPRHPPSVRAAAIDGSTMPMRDFLVGLDDSDPFIRHVAIRRLARNPNVLTILELGLLRNNKPKLRLAILLASRASSEHNSDAPAAYLSDSDPDVRFLAIKWISDAKLTERRSEIEKMLAKPGVDAREFVGLATTLARLDDKPVDDNALADYFLQRFNDKASPASARAMALRSIPANFAKLRTDSLLGVFKEEDAGLRLEVLRTLTERSDPKAADVLVAVVRDPQQQTAIRAQALVGLSPRASENAFLFLDVAADTNGTLRKEALRGLTQAKLTAEQRKKLESVTVTDDEVNLRDRVLGKAFVDKRPPLSDTDAWLKRLEGPADSETGRRIFEHPRVASCAKCHRADGRGANIGPDLSLIGRTDRKWIVESILQPSAVVAPHYQAWQIRTLNERTLTGLLVGTHLDESVYIDAKGDRFKVLATEVADVTPAKNSIMPDNLVDTLTDQELRDLIAYLTSRK
jgi:putative heme-binding domain-containing protein